MTPADKRTADYRRIHGLARLLGQSEEQYRDMLSDRYGVRSSKDLHPNQRRALIADLARQVAAGAKRFTDLADRSRDKATPAQLRAIEAMWAKVSRQTTSQARSLALDSFCSRLTGCRCIRWITKVDARTMIKAINAMGALSPEQYNQQPQEVNNG